MALVGDAETPSATALRRVQIAQETAAFALHAPMALVTMVKPAAAAPKIVADACFAGMDSVPPMKTV